MSSTISIDNNGAGYEEQGKWNIDSELERLKKVPVARTRIQVKMIQMLYRGLKNKEKSDECISVQKTSISCEASPVGKVDWLVYTPKGKENEVLPAVLLLHGGALVLPALPYHYRLARHMARRTGSRVFMPHYDLAPEHKSPVQYKEAFDFYSYLLRNAADLRIDPSRIVLVGDSAGATLCASLCLILRDASMPLPAGQVLLYPSLDARLTSRSMQLYTDVPIVNARAVRFYYKLCAPETSHEGSRQYASPVEAESLQGMPPTYVETAEFDCLHDDGILYADRLSKENCKVVLNETKGTVHAYDIAENSTVLKDSMEKRIAFINSLITIDS